LKFNRAITLIEALVTVAILSTAIVFVFRSFATAFSANRFAQNLTLACYLAQDKMWQVEMVNPKERRIQDNGSEKIQNRDFNWKYEIVKTSTDRLSKLRFTISWQESAREKEYPVEFHRLLLTEK